MNWDTDLIGILIVMVLIVVCLAPDMREIVLVMSLCMNAINLTSELQRVHKTRDASKKEGMDVQPPLPPRPLPLPSPPTYTFTDYPGRIDYDEPPPIHYSYGNDRIAHMQLNHPGTDYVRQINGSMNRKRRINPYVRNDCDTDEYRDWWSRYD